MVPIHVRSMVVALMLCLASCAPENLDRYRYWAAPISNADTNSVPTPAYTAANNQAKPAAPIPSGKTPGDWETPLTIDKSQYSTPLAMTIPFYCNPIRYTSYQIANISSCDSFLEDYFKMDRFPGPRGGNVAPYPPPPLGGAIGYPQIGHDDDDFPTGADQEESRRGKQRDRDD